MSRFGSSSSLSCLSIFTGAGGLDLGLEAAGFELIGCIEADETCRKTIRANRPQWQQLSPHDVAEFAIELRSIAISDQFCNVDLLAGGPPCQPFSKAAQWRPSARAGLADPRATALDGFLKLTDILTPKAVLLENVAGFAMGSTSALGYIQTALSEINKRHGTSYDLNFAILDAADYGVPQRRKRALLLAFRDGGADWEWPEPTHDFNPVTAWDALHDVSVEDPPEPQGKWANLLPSIPEGENYLWHTNRGGGVPLFGYRTRFWSFLLKLAKDKPSWTLPANPGPSTGPFHWNNRPLAPMEVLRLQSFPLEWKLKGPRCAQQRQAGNATPPLLAEVIGAAVARYLDPGMEQRMNFKHAIPAAASTAPAPSQPAGIAPQYFGLVGNHADHPGTGKGPNPVSVSSVATSAGSNAEIE